MTPHTDFELRTDKLTGTKYRKCSSCRKVAFVDDYSFNMNCLVRARITEDLRERLSQDLQEEK